LEVADAVAIGIHVGAHRQAVDDRIFVPEIVDHAWPRFTVWSPHVCGVAEGATNVHERGECTHPGDGGTMECPIVRRVPKRRSKNDAAGAQTARTTRQGGFMRMA